MCTCKVPCSAPDGSVVFRPCGKCLDCLRQYQQNWTCRLDNEFKAWQSESVIFFTLTYSDDMLPVQVTYNHPVTKSCISSVLRYKSVSFLADRFRRVGLDSFFYTRDLKHNTQSFLKSRKAFQDSYLDVPEFERPALFVPTACYTDVNTWIRYCRKYFDRHEVSVSYKDRRVNRYLKDLNFVNVHNVSSDYPDSAYTPSFKYFITSEYGPSTLRPHYHGVLFGVSEEMFRDVFAPWWIDHFGCGSKRSCKYSVWDANKGGSLYISKYCSKGSFEHPLCSKSIHYPSGKEYISRSFINCERWFGLDFPLCEPSFRLISKGIGVRYPFSSDIQRYWNIQCDEFTGFVCKDLEVHQVPYSFIHDFELSEISLAIHDTSIQGIVPSWCWTETTLNKLNDRHRRKLIGQSSIVQVPFTPHDYLQLIDSTLSKRFIRLYIHEGVAKTFESLLPRYYRRYLLSPFTQNALSIALRNQSDDVFNRERKFVKSQKSEDSHDAALCQIRRDKAFQSGLSAEKISSRFNRFYSRTFAGDMI